MAAFIIANYTVTDPEAFGPYPEAATKTLETHGAEIVAMDLNSEVMEGDPKPVTVILKFGSKEAAKTCYNSPEYQAVIGLRTDNSEGSMVLIENAG